MTDAPRTRPSTTSPQLRRLAGTALIAAFALQVIGFLAHPATEELQHVQRAMYGPAHTILFVSWVLAMLGLPALYSAQAERAGRLGLVAFVATMAATAYHLYLTLYEAAAIPVIAAQPDAAGLVGAGSPLAHGAGALGVLAGVLVLAFPLMGVVTLRARVLPRSSGWLQVAAVPTFVVLMLVIGLVTGGPVGPEASNWISGMLPISALYWVLFAGYAVGGQALRQRAAEPAAAHQNRVSAASTVR